MNLKFWKKKKVTPKTPPLVQRYNSYLEIMQELEDILYWFSENKSESSEEIRALSDVAWSRMQALKSAILIKVRNKAEQEQVERMKAIHESRKRYTEIKTEVEAN
jgi:hypothetical protein